ncbi:MAG: alanine racemase, partial [Candidatus Saccharibacteria bacterium]|nr:alanine racemase [Candidatus Saccharibacteria bacterium]
MNKSARAIINTFLRRFEKSYEVFNEISLSIKSLVHNIELLETLSPQNTIIPVLKSNAYGHGLREITGMLK